MLEAMFTVYENQFMLCSQKFSKVIATRFSKTSQEVTLTITMRDRNHELIILLFSSNAKRFWKLHDGKITITSLLHIQKHSATVLHGLQTG